MSVYCGFLDGDVFMHLQDDERHITCHACCMVKVLTKPDPSFELRSEAVAHLEEHRQHGHRVPDIAFISLRQEINEKGDLVKVA